MLEISENTIRQVEARLAGIPGGAEKAYTKAINTALAEVKKSVYAEVVKEYAIDKKTLEDYTKINIQKASTSNLCGSVIFSGKQIPLYKYSLTNPKNPSRHLALQVIGGQKTAAPLDGAFVQTMSNGHTGIFVNTGGISEKTGNPKIRELMGSSLRSMASNVVVLDEAYKNAQKKLNNTLEKEIERLLKG